MLYLVGPGGDQLPLEAFFVVERRVIAGQQPPIAASRLGPRVVPNPDA